MDRQTERVKQKGRNLTEYDRQGGRKGSNRLTGTENSDAKLIQTKTDPVVPVHCDGFKNRWNTECALHCMVPPTPQVSMQIWTQVPRTKISCKVCHLWQM